MSKAHLCSENLFSRFSLPILKSNWCQITNNPPHTKARDGILFTSLRGMTFMLSCCPILSAGVARRQQHPHYNGILGNDGTNKRILPICRLLSALNVAITWVSVRVGCYANGPLGHYGEDSLCPACRSRWSRFEPFSCITPHTKSM